MLTLHRPGSPIGRFGATRLLPVALALLAACGPVSGIRSGSAERETMDRTRDDGLTAVVGVTVLPMDGDTLLERQTVIVRDGLIERIGPTASLTVPRNATLISGAGKYLIPGLVEMHAHIPPPQAGAAEVEHTLFLYLSRGVTTIRGMLGDPEHLRLRARSAADEILAPRIYTSGPSFSGQTAPDPASARRRAEEQARAGYDLFKLHPGLTREVFDTVVAAAQRLGMPFGGHVSVDVGIPRTLEARQATIDHLDGYIEYLAHGNEPPGAIPGFFGYNFIDRVDTTRIADIVRRTREAGVANVPTQTLAMTFAGPADPGRLAELPEMRYVSRQTLAQWTSSITGMRGGPDFTRERADRYLELRRRLIRELHRAGAPILLGSDAPQFFNVPGFSAVRELVLMVDAGLSPYEALVAATRAPAEHFGATGEWGTIRPGRSADFILLDGNPLIDIRNVERQSGVMVRGRWLSAAEIQEGLERIARLRAG